MPFRFQSAVNILLPYIWASLLSLFILWVVFPGFMSYDSLHALREARSVVRGGAYPPFVSYVWRIFDFIWPGPALMLTVQNLVLLLSLAHIYLDFFPTVSEPHSLE